MLKKIGLLLTSVSLAIMGLVAAPLVSAEGGSGDSGSGGQHSGDQNTTQNSQTSGSTSTGTTDEQKTSTGTSESSGKKTSSTDRSGQSEDSTHSGTDSSGGSNKGDGGSLQSRAAKLLADRRDSNHTNHDKEQRQKACTEHKDDIDKKLGNLGGLALGHLNAFNNLFEKIKAYQEKNQLNVANYDALVAAATSAQAAATTAVNAVKGNPATVDCTADDPATTVAVNKTAIDDARTALQAYRNALKDLVNALLAAKQAAGITNESGDTHTDKTPSTSTSGGTQ